ncbi:MAG: hypothetical protein RJA63_1537 [Pseudomonadota bacterium]
MERSESPPFGIHRIDSGYLRAQMDAIHLIVQDGRAAIVESGTTHAVPQVLAALSRVGLTPDAVDWVMLTHIHLDHAGGAGALLQALPRARLLVHPRGVRHMCDPSRLWAASAAVYGEAFVAREYGLPVPVAVERITEANEGRVVMLGGRPIEVAETPGHARHHVCYWDAVSRGWFTGDAFGLSYRETHVGDRAFVVPATTPSQFEPDAMHSSIERLLAKQPERMFLTHYGEVGEVPRLAADLHRLIDAFCALARASVTGGDRLLQQEALFGALRQLLLQEAAEQGWAVQGDAALALYADDLILNAQGLAGWLNEAF